MAVAPLTSQPLSPTSPLHHSHHVSSLFFPNQPAPLSISLFTSFSHDRYRCLLAALPASSPLLLLLLLLRHQPRQQEKMQQQAAHTILFSFAPFFLLCVWLVIAGDKELIDVSGSAEETMMTAGRVAVTCMPTSGESTESNTFVGATYQVARQVLGELPQGSHRAIDCRNVAISSLWKVRAQA